MNGFVARFWPIIALAFPVLELVGIIYIWGTIGPWTLLWLLLAVLAGAALISVERIAFLPGLAGAMLGGGNPFAALKVSGLRFLAGVMLIFPGPISDVLAIFLLLLSGFRPTPRRPAGRPENAANDDVIEGDYRRID